MLIDALLSRDPEEFQVLEGSFRRIPWADKEYAPQDGGDPFFPPPTKPFISGD